MSNWKTIMLIAMTCCFYVEGDGFIFLDLYYFLDHALEDQEYYFGCFSDFYQMLSMGDSINHEVVTYRPEQFLVEVRWD